MRRTLPTRLITLALAAAAFLPALNLTASARQTGAADADKPRAEFKREWTWATDSQAKWDSLRRTVDKPAPPLQVGPWHNAQSVSLADLKGKIVVIDFWATWCRPCREAIPDLNNLMDEYKDRGVAVIGVCNTNERNGGSMIEVASRSEIAMKYPTAQDLRNRTAAAYGVQWWPFIVLVDRKGDVRMTGLQPAKLREALDALLAEQPL
ncbi:MAG: TlpA disulfide reductase family protein [Planctomycetota bacterium]|nr:TlpA disulfide reductase family protein [Planctomycetota bacterium]